MSRSKHYRKLIDECAIGLCLKQWEYGKDTFEMWATKHGTMIIHIYADDKGFEVYKSSPCILISSTVEWINRDDAESMEDYLTDKNFKEFNGEN